MTGAIIVALGHDHAGLFANDDCLADPLIAATARRSASTVAPAARRQLMTARSTSMRPTSRTCAGDRAAGSIIGAQFLKRFVNNVPWAHLDIAGMAWSNKDAPIVPAGATAFGVRLLDRFVAEHYEKG